MEKTIVLLDFDFFGKPKDLSITQEILAQCKSTGIEARLISPPPMNGDWVHKTFQYCVKDLDLKGMIVLLSPFFPFRRAEHINDAIRCYEESDCPLLITMNSQGIDLESLYISHSDIISTSDSIFTHLKRSFIWMGDDAAFVKAHDNLEWKSLKSKGISTLVYSTEKQKELAAKYRDNIREYDPEFLEPGTVVSDPVVRRSMRDAPERMARLTEIVHQLRPQSILDVGCSSGNLTIRYARKITDCTRIVGVDIDSELIQTAQKYRNTEPATIQDRLRFVCSPFEELPEGDIESYDVLSATEFLEHMLSGNHATIMNKMLRFLKKEGHCILSVPNRFPSEIYQVQKRYRWDWYNHYSHFTATSLRHWMKRYFREVRFHTVYDEPIENGIFLIAEGRGKLS